MADLEEFFKEQIKPYEERIKKLEELDKKKDVEITLLKAAISYTATSCDATQLSKGTTLSISSLYF